MPAWPCPQFEQDKGAWKQCHASPGLPRSSHRPWGSLLPFFFHPPFLCSPSDPASFPVPEVLAFSTQAQLSSQHRLLPSQICPSLLRLHFQFPPQRVQRPHTHSSPCFKILLIQIPQRIPLAYVYKNKSQSCPEAGDGSFGSRAEQTQTLQCTCPAPPTRQGHTQIEWN